MRHAGSLQSPVEHDHVAAAGRRLDCECVRRGPTRRWRREHWRRMLRNHGRTIGIEMNDAAAGGDGGRVLMSRFAGRQYGSLTGVRTRLSTRRSH